MPKKNRLYVIGDRGYGVLLVTTNPLRVVHIDDKSIKEYSNSSSSDGYAKAAAAYWRLICDSKGGAEISDATMAKGIESLVSAGVELTDVTFAFAGTINSATVSVNRQIYMPIEDSISKVISEDAEVFKSSILSDDVKK